MNSITEWAAIVGLVSVIVMASIMLIWAIQAHAFSTPQGRTVTVESGSMPIVEEVRHD